MSELSTRAREWLETLLNVAECCERDAERGVGERGPKYWHGVAEMHRYLLGLVGQDERRKLAVVDFNPSDGSSLCALNHERFLREIVTPEYRPFRDLAPASLKRFTDKLRRAEMATTEGCEAKQEPTLAGVMTLAAQQVGDLDVTNGELEDLNRRLERVVDALGGSTPRTEAGGGPETEKRREPSGKLAQTMAYQNRGLAVTQELLARIDFASNTLARIERLLSVPEQDREPRDIAEDALRRDPGIDSSMEGMRGRGEG